MDEKKYDIATITAADFTIEMDITDEMYENFLFNEYKDHGDQKTEESGHKYSSALYLKKYLQEQIEELLNNDHEYNLNKHKNDEKEMEKLR